MNPEMITIDSFSALQSAIGPHSVSLKWTVYPTIGPSWIGSYREITVRVDGESAGENEFWEKMINWVVEKLEIPATSEDILIEGFGEIIWKEGILILEYEEDGSIPYDWPSKRSSGELVISGAALGL